MAVQFITKDEFEHWRDNLTGFFRTTIDETVRSSDRRITIVLRGEIHEARAEAKADKEELKAEIQEARDEAKADNAKTRKDLLAGMKEIRLEFRDEDKALHRIIEGVRDLVVPLYDEFEKLHRRVTNLETQQASMAQQMAWLVRVIGAMAARSGMELPPQP